MANFDVHPASFSASSFSSRQEADYTSTAIFKNGQRAFIQAIDHLLIMDDERNCTTDRERYHNEYHGGDKHHDENSVSAFHQNVSMLPGS
jgi:hypothetical protein